MATINTRTWLVGLRAAVRRRREAWRGRWVEARCLAAAERQRDRDEFQPDDFWW